jgi:hypothetical protein
VRGEVGACQRLGTALLRSMTAVLLMKAAGDRENFR